MRDTAEIATLRTMLKKVNVEYSTALRGTDHDAKPGARDALRKQRLALTNRIGGVETAPERPRFAGLERGADRPQYRWLSGSVRTAQVVTTTGQWDWRDGSAVPSRSNDGANGVVGRRIPRGECGRQSSKS